MVNPRIIIKLLPAGDNGERLDIPGAIYMLPTYKVTDDGLKFVDYVKLKFCKGNKSDPSVFRQDGYFTESLIQVAKMYLEDVNVGDLKNPDTEQAILKLEEALMWIGKRAKDREIRGVQGTYQK